MKKTILIFLFLYSIFPQDIYSLAPTSDIKPIVRREDKIDKQNFHREPVGVIFDIATAKLEDGIKYQSLKLLQSAIMSFDISIEYTSADNIKALLKRSLACKEYAKILFLTKRDTPNNITRNDSKTYKRVLAFLEKSIYDLLYILKLDKDNENATKELKEIASFRFDKGYQTFLYLACSYKEYEHIALTLLQYDADPTIPASFGWTPLQAAAKNGMVEVVKEIIEKTKEDREYINKECGSGRGRHNALSFAEKHGHIKICDILIAAGAQRPSVYYGKRISLSSLKSLYYIPGRIIHYPFNKYRKLAKEEENKKNQATLPVGKKDIITEGRDLTTKDKETLKNNSTEYSSTLFSEKIKEVLINVANPQGEYNINFKITPEEFASPSVAFWFKENKIFTIYLDRDFLDTNKNSQCVIDYWVGHEIIELSLAYPEIFGSFLTKDDIALLENIFTNKWEEKQSELKNKNIWRLPENQKQDITKEFISNLAALRFIPNPNQEILTLLIQRTEEMTSNDKIIQMFRTNNRENELEYLLELKRIFETMLEIGQPFNYNFDTIKLDKPSLESLAQAAANSTIFAYNA